MDTPRKDTAAWMFQAWASFALAFGMTLLGIWWLPVESWAKGFLAMGTIFTVGSAFSLAKTVRDNHEAERWVNRIQSAKVDKLVAEYTE